MPTSKPEKKEPKKPLSVTHPELAKQAVGWDPSSVTKGSHKNLSWKCSENHKWNATVKDRTQGRGCPLCFLASPRKFKPLATENPTLAKQAFGWNPMDFGVASNKKMTWKCELEHTWDATIRSRSGSRGCPYCSNNKIWPGFNDIATTHPEISKTIYEGNPKTISAGSEEKFKWICSTGHIFEMEVRKRIGRNYGCPYCSNSKLLIGFNDFETKHPKIAKEADGWDPKTVIGGSAVFRNWKCNKGHRYKAKVSSRDASDSGCPYCANQALLAGFNDLATTHPELAIQADGWDPTKVISNRKNVNWKCNKGHKTKATISTRKSGAGCRVCANQEVLFGYNDLETKYPEIATEAVGWDPRKVFPKSSKQLMWRCSKGHSWKATVGSRTGLEAGCPYCSGNKVLAGFNDLLTTHPELSKELLDGDPETLSKGSNTKFTWKCNLGHTWKATVGDRTTGYGCPSCSVGGFDPNKDGWLYFMEHEKFGYLQIGITNNPEKRLKVHSKLGWELLQLRGPMDGHLTANWETSILKMLRAKNAQMGPSKNDLNKTIFDKTKSFIGTEMWLKASFPAESITALMRFTEEFEEQKIEN
jgi:hypothetical protein